jgi:hypothetical protein
MKTQRIALALTLVNLVLLVWQLTQHRSVAAQAGVGQKSNSTDAIAPVLRGRALELVDERGRVRAEIKIFPADPKVKLPDGTTGYPETVLLRLIDSEGAPNVKLSAMEDGSGLVLGGEKSYAQFLSRGANPFIKLLNQAGQEQVIKP